MINQLFSDTGDHGDIFKELKSDSYNNSNRHIIRYRNSSMHAFYIDIMMKIFNRSYFY